MNQFDFSHGRYISQKRKRWFVNFWVLEKKFPDNQILIFIKTVLSQEQLGHSVWLFTR